MNISEGMIGNRNYENGKIYKLVNDVNNKIYVGSTTTTLARRKCWHKSKGTMMPGVKIIFDDIGWDQLKIVLVESFPCNTNDELRQRERFWYDELKPDLNRIRPWVGKDEAKQEKKQRNDQYRENNKDKIQQYKKEYRGINKDKMKQYREHNKDAIKEQTKQYYNDNKDTIKQYKKQYQKDNGDKIKQYYTNNKDKIKQYYTNNKNKIKQDHKQQVECVCGGTMRKDNLRRHIRSPKHIQYQTIYDFITM